MKLTKELKKAGILEIGSQNMNGSWVCLVKTDRIDLSCDLTNFRPCDDAHVARIVAAFDPLAVNNPVLWHRIGKYTLATVDGRHTTTACLKIDEIRQKNGETRQYDTMICNVFFGKTLEQMAQNFCNNQEYRKRMNQYQQLHALSIAADPWALALIGLFEQFDFTWGKNKDVESIRPYKEMYKDGGLRMMKKLVSIMTVYKNRNGRLNQPASGCEFVRGLKQLIIRHSQFSTKQLKQYLGQRNASDMQSIASISMGKKKDRPCGGDYCRAMETCLPL